MKRRGAYRITSNNTYRLWILSYLAIAVLPLLLGGVIYFLSIGTLKQVLKENYQREVQHLSDRMDAVLSEMQEIAQTLMVQSDLEYVSRQAAEDMAQTNRVVRLNEVQKLLKFYSLNELIEDIYVLFPRSEYVVSKDQCHYYHNQKEVWAIPSGFSKKLLLQATEPEEYNFLEAEPSTNGLVLYYGTTNL